MGSARTDYSNLQGVLIPLSGVAFTASATASPIPAIPVPASTNTGLCTLLSEGIYADETHTFTVGNEDYLYVAAREDATREEYLGYPYHCVDTYPCSGPIAKYGNGWIDVKSGKHWDPVNGFATGTPLPALSGALEVHCGFTLGDTVFGFRYGGSSYLAATANQVTGYTSPVWTAAEASGMYVSYSHLQAACLYVDGVILMVINGKLDGAHPTAPDEYTFAQIVSIDHGLTWTLIEDWEGSVTAATGFGICPNLMLHPDGRILFVYNKQDTGSVEVVCRVISSPYDPLLSATPHTLSTTDALQISACLGLDGKLIVFENFPANPNTIRMNIYNTLDFDSIQTQFVFGDDSGVDLMDRDATQAGFQAVAAGDSVFITIRPKNGLYQGERLICRLGGWGIIPEPENIYTLVPNDDGAGNLLPDTRGWTLAATAMTYDTATGMWDQDLVAGQGNYYADGLMSVLHNDGNAHFTLQVVTGGSLSSEDISFRLRRANGTNDHDVEMRFTTTGFRLVDLNGAPDTLYTATYDTTERTVYGIITDGDDVTLEWKTCDSDAGDRLKAGPFTCINDTATPAADSRTAWGHRAVSTAHSRWGAIRVFQGMGFSSISPIPPTSKFSLGQGTIIEKVGDFLPGDTFTVAPTWEYPAVSLNPIAESSTTTEWRSPSDAATTDHYLYWTVSTDSLGPIYGVILIGANFRLGSVQGYNAGTATWVTLGSIDGAEGLTSTQITGVTWDGTGYSFGRSTGTATRYLKRNELVGGTAKYSTAPGEVDYILRNTEGLWAANSKTPIITVDEARPAHVIDYIARPNFGIIISGNDLSTTYTQYRLKIPAQTTPDDYFRLRKLIVGPIAVFGSRYSHGRSVEVSPNTTLTRHAGGKTRTVVEAPPSRVVTFGWADGVDQKQLQGTSGAPDYRTTGAGAGARAVASVGDGPRLMAGILEQTSGSHVPVVYLPNITPGVATQSLLERDDFVYGRITSSETMTTERGAESTDEVMTASRITITEEAG